MIPTKLKSFNPLWILLWVAVLTFYYLQFIGTLGLNVDLKDEWSASKSWIASAECARTTGILLVGCSGGNIIPFAEISLADDIGHALLLGIYSMTTNNILSLDDAGKLNIFLNFSGIFLVSILLLSAKLQWSAIFILIVGSFIAADHISVMPHAGLIGISCFALILPMAILLFQNASTRKAIIWLIIGAVSLSLTMMLRQATGMMGVVATFFALAYAQYSSKLWARRTALATSALLLTLAAGYATTTTLAARDAIWSVPPTAMIDRHGIQHNLFIGLGVVPNKFGIVWSDSFGKETVEKINPSVRYASKEYYRILGDEYIRLLKSDPYEFISIYTKKNYIFMSTQINGSVWMSISIIFGIIISYCVYFLSKSKEIIHYSNNSFIIIISSIFILMHIGQAIIIHPSIQYASPIKFFLLLIISTALQITLSRPDAEKAKV